MKAFLKKVFAMIERLIYKLFKAIIIREMKLLNRERLFNVLKTETPWDYVRYSSLELVAYEIKKKKIKGDLAEVGVYKGEFAAKINECFPDRKLYLFDTFCGFDERDLNRDKKNDLIFCDQMFNYSNIQKVLNKMKYPANCIVKKGYFPESIGDIDGTFTFVSLDADLFNPTYEGLKFFYPRLAKGGYIFVNDYNNYKFGGAKKAVLKFSEEQNISYFLLCDITGSAIFTK